MFAYYGGKYSQSEWIDLSVPYDIETYVEPFGGAFWVYFRGGFDSRLLFANLEKVVYNDFSKNNFNLFRCIKRYDEFYNYIKDIDPNRDELYQKYRYWFYWNGEKTDLNDFELTPEADFERALRYIYVMTHTFSGGALNSSRNIPKGSGPRYVAFRKRLHNPKFIQKIKRITEVENLDYQEVIEKNDGPQTFFYVDPPYFNVGDYSIDTFDEIGLAEHERLFGVLKKLKGRFMLSYYHFPELDQWFPPDEFRWKTKNYKKASGNRKGVATSDSEELVIMNF